MLNPSHHRLPVGLISPVEGMANFVINAGEVSGSILMFGQVLIPDSIQISSLIRGGRCVDFSVFSVLSKVSPGCHLLSFNVFCLVLEDEWPNWNGRI